MYLTQVGPSLAPYMIPTTVPGAESSPAVAAFVERWKKTKGRVTNALPNTMQMYDTTYIVADMFKWVLKNNLPATGENMRKALQAIKKFDVPMIGRIEITDDADGHRVVSPVHLLHVKDGKFVHFDDAN